MPGNAAQHDLLSKPVESLILRIALPGMAGMLASSLAALFDALLLGRQSPQLLAAVSLCFPLLTIIQTIGFTLGMGAGSFVSRSLGRDDHPAARRAASTALYLALLLCLLLGVPGFAFASPMMRLLGAQGDALAPAAAYARCVLLCAPLLCANLVLSSLLRAQGKAVSNMIAFVLGALVSLGILLCFLGRLSLFIAGAAMLAREIGTLLILSFALLREKALVRPRLSAFSLRLSALRDIMQSGLPTLLRQGLVSVSSAMLMKTAASFGEAALSGMGLAVRILSVVSSAIIGFSQGFQPVCGAAFGAGEMDRLREGSGHTRLAGRRFFRHAD